jgi:hypothetical protein
MATTAVTPDYRTNQTEGFTSPLDEADRFAENRELHFNPEREQSGNLPGQPDTPDAAPGNARPWKPL